MSERKLIEIEGVETLELVVRNVDGIGVLFTHDGKMVGHQVEKLSNGQLCPHYYYDGHPPAPTFRATFIVSNMKPDVPK